MKKANDKFSRLCSQILRILRSGWMAFDELAAFGGPSECGALIASSVDRDLRETLAESGYSPRAFYDEVENRTTAKCAYFMFGEILHLISISEVEKASERLD